MNRKLLIGIAGCFLVGAAIVILYLTRSHLPKESGRIKVGTILGLTGNYASYGIEMQQGFKFALDEINSKGGVNGKEIQLVIENSEFVPTKAVTAYRKLTGFEGIRIIVGITGSKNALPVCEASKSDNVVIVDALGSAPKLTTHGGPNYFRVMASDTLAGKYNVEWAIEGGMKRPSIVYMEDEWGTSYRDAIITYLRDKGFNDVPTHGVTAETREFRTQVEKIRVQSPDTIFLLLYAKEGSSFVQQLRQAGVLATIYGSDNISSAEFVSSGPEVVEGVRVAMPAPAHGLTYEDFVDRYRAKYGNDPDTNIMKSYDAMKLVASAIGRVGEDPQKIRDLLRSPAFEYQGVTGLIKFDKNGDITSQEYTRMVYQNGKLVQLK